MTNVRTLRTAFIDGRRYSPGEIVPNYEGPKAVWLIPEDAPIPKDAKKDLFPPAIPKKVKAKEVEAAPAPAATKPS